MKVLTSCPLVLPLANPRVDSWRLILNYGRRTRPRSRTIPVPIGGIRAAATDTDVSISGTEACPGMGVAAKYPDGQAIGDPIVNTDAAPAGRKIIAPYSVVIFDRDPITPAIHPYPSGWPGQV